MKSAVIVLDGDQRSALATTRALGRLGYQVIVADSAPSCLAGASKYCSGRLMYPNPVDAEAFTEWLLTLDAQQVGAVLLPMSDVTVPLVLRTRLKNLRTALPALEAYDAVSDKYRLFELATKLNVRVPETVVVSRRTISVLDVTRFRFPAVIKPKLSAARTTSGLVKRVVRYAHSQAELRDLVDESLVDDEDEVLIQEFVDGVGEGIFALYDRGKPLFFFSHRRLREKPPSGGVSVLSESIRPNERAYEAARAILDAVGWHGIAMVEFKIGSSSEAWLIEVNGRFWGSLQLAVDSGANFPSMVCQLATGEDVEVPVEYSIGRRLRWLLGDIDSLYAKLRYRRYAPTLRAKASAIARFCLPWMPGLRYELLRVSDPAPAIFATRRYIESLCR